MLNNACNDSKDIANKLRQYGFTVIEKEDLNQIDFNRTISDFANKASAYDEVLIYYAGHAIENKGVNYLIPINAAVEQVADLETECVSANNIMDKLEGTERKTNIIVLDACRETFRGGPNTRGLARMEEAPNTYFMFSTSSGHAAFDGTGRNSPYTTAFLQSLETSASQPLEMFAKQVLL